MVSYGILIISIDLIKRAFFPFLWILNKYGQYASRNDQDYSMAAYKIDLSKD